MNKATRKKIQHIWRVHNASQDLKCIEINGRLIYYDSFTCARRAVVFFKMREARDYVLYNTNVIPYDMIEKIVVNGMRCIYD